MSRRLLLIGRAIATGLVVTVLLQLAAAVPIGALRRWGGDSWLRHWVLRAAPQLVPPVAALIAGWVVGRLQRTDRRAAVLSSAAFVVVMGMPRLIGLAVNAASQPRFRPYILVHVMNIVVVAGAVIAGGLWLGSAEPPLSLTPERTPDGNANPDRTPNLEHEPGTLNPEPGTRDGL